jgi:hypothetical protein
MSLFTMLGLVIVGAIVFAIVQVVAVGGEVKKLKAALAATPQFRPANLIVAADGSALLAHDAAADSLLFIKNSATVPVKRPITYKQLIGSEVIEDGQSLTETRRGSQIGGAIVGGVLLGGVGAVIGGLSGKKRTVSEVSRVALRLTIESTSSPVIEIHLLAVKVRKDSVLYTSAHAQAVEWHGRLTALIRRAEREQQQSVQSAPALPPLPAPPTASVADELQKLADLKTSGVLTDDEFAAEKRRLLARS